MNRYMSTKGKRQKIRIDQAFRAGSYYVERRNCNLYGPTCRCNGGRLIRVGARRRMQGEPRRNVMAGILLEHMRGDVTPAEIRLIEAEVEALAGGVFV